MKQDSQVFPEFLKKEFKKWAKNTKATSTINNYQTWINQLPIYIKGTTLKLPNDINNFLENYLELINAFVKAGDRLYALSVFDKVYEIVRKAKEQCSDDNWKNRHSAFIALGNFLTEYSYNPADDVNYEDVSKMRNCIKKSELHKLDGMDVLLSALGEEKFIKKAVSGSFFFSPTIVADPNWSNDKKKARFTEDVTIIVPEKQVKSTAKISKGSINAVYTIDGKNYSGISVDKDGNAFVRELINKITGVTVASGKKALIQNTIISHIWGRAFDPRYFTSLWNIVLIPSWANSLMDKEDATEGSVAYKIRATYMKICYELYTKVFKDRQYWVDLDMSSSPRIIGENVVINGKYDFNIIMESPNSSKVVLITRESVELKGKRQQGTE